MDGCVTPPGGYTVRLWIAKARALVEMATDTTLEAWDSVTTACDTDKCLAVSHLIVTRVTHILYPDECVYCGMPAGTKDHLMPRGWTGEARRRTVAVVPACGDCNSRINDLPSWNIDERRAKAHASLRKSKRKVLSAPRWSDDDLSELGHGLRTSMIAFRQEREVTEARLSWPEDKLYDIAAFQRSGIVDPVSVGFVTTNPVG